MFFAADSGGDGLILLAVMVAVVVVLWPLYRWALRGLGVVFIASGVYLLVAGASGGDGHVGQALGLIGGGVVLRLITSRRRPPGTVDEWERRPGSQREEPARY
jgi:hypothetical protein